MTENVNEETRKRIAGFLPDALDIALQSYHSFLRSDIPPDAKGFSAHHSACKIAIAHIELLLKLAKWAHLPDDNVVGEDQQRRLVTILEDAQAEYNAYCEAYKSPDEAG